MNSEKQQLHEINLTDIIPDENQPRHDFSGIEDFANLIKIQGQLSPNFVEKIEENKYKIIDGERRWRAMLHLTESDRACAIKTIRAICVEGNKPENGFLINILRENYSPLEIACALKKLKESKGFNITELGEYLNKSRVNISEYLSLASLPEPVKEIALQNKCIPFSKLRQLAVNDERSEELKLEEIQRLNEEYPAEKNEAPKRSNDPRYIAAKKI